MYIKMDKVENEPLDPPSRPILFHLYPHLLHPSHIILKQVGKVIREPDVWSMPGDPLQGKVKLLHPVPSTSNKDIVLGENTSLTHLLGALEGSQL